MPDGLKEFSNQVANFWRGLSNPKRFALVVLTSLVLVSVAVVSVLGSRKHLVPLYSGMDPKDAASIVEKLDAQKIPYELASGGTTVLVPEENLHRLRLEMASQGLPKGSAVGFELFDKSQFGATEFEQQVNLRRALEGELARSIGTVEGVESARVHLVLPRSSVFLTKKEQASASVVVNLRNPALFGKREVAAVVHLVAAAVPGLSRGNVSVVSTEGQTLHKPSMGEGAFAGETMAEESAALATQLESRALAQLERVVGPGGADVRVTLTLDPSTHEQTKEVFQPEKTALRSEQASEERVRSQSPGAEGIPGARTNLPDNSGGTMTQATAAQNVESTERNSHTKNWEIDRTVEKVHTPPGSVARLTVAVLLDGTWKKSDKGPETFTPRTKEEVEQLTEIVKQAVGYDQLRGDSITVSAMKFARETPTDTQGVELVPLWKKPWVLLATIGGVVLAMLLLLVLAFRSRKQKKLAELAMQRKMAELEEAKGKKSSEGSEEDLGPDEIRRLQMVDPRKLLTGGPDAIAALRSKALELSASDPSTTAVVLRSWLEESSAGGAQAAE